MGGSAKVILSYEIEKEGGSSQEGITELYKKREGEGDREVRHCDGGFFGLVSSIHVICTCLDTRGLLAIESGSLYANCCLMAHFVGNT